MKIDSHHHFWKYDAREYPWIDASMRELRRNFGIDELRPELVRCGVNGVVTVQARQSIEESDELLEMAAATPEVLGVVGWVPLVAEEADLVPQLDSLCQGPWMKGVRHVIQDETDDRFLLRNDFNRGIGLLSRYSLVYDILVYARQLPSTVAMVDRHPNQIFVLDHIAKPTIHGKQFDADWAENLRQLAKRDNVYCKFSGVVTEVRDDRWTIDTVIPYWETVLNVFGADRLMFGSDWPVCLLRSRYDQWISCVEELTRTLTPHERRSFWSSNACNVYGLAPLAAVRPSGSRE